MSYESTLEDVRRLSERATVQPATRALRLTRAEDLRLGAPRLAVETYEELHPPALLKPVGRASGQDARKADHCSICGKRPKYCTCGAVPEDKDFIVRALEKTLNT